MNKQKEVLFTREKETKHTIRYSEIPAEGEPILIGTLYVQKWWAHDAKHLTVLVTKEGE